MTVTAHQLIAQGFAQAPQGIAHRGLGQGQIVCGPRQAAFGHDFVEDPQQVQVQGPEGGRDGGVHGR